MKSVGFVRRPDEIAIIDESGVLEYKRSNDNDRCKSTYRTCFGQYLIFMSLKGVDGGHALVNFQQASGEMA